MVNWDYAHRATEQVWHEFVRTAVKAVGETADKTRIRKVLLSEQVAGDPSMRMAALLASDVETTIWVGSEALVTFSCGRVQIVDNSGYAVFGVVGDELVWQFGDPQCNHETLCSLPFWRQFENLQIRADLSRIEAERAVENVETVKNVLLDVLKENASDVDETADICSLVSAVKQCLTHGFTKIVHTHPELYESKVYAFVKRNGDSVDVELSALMFDSDPLVLWITAACDMEPHAVMFEKKWVFSYETM